MTERTERDEAVDEAVEHLIDEETEAFAVVACKGDEVVTRHVGGGDLGTVEVLLLAAHVEARTAVEASEVVDDETGEVVRRGVVSVEDVYASGGGVAQTFDYRSASTDMGGSAGEFELGSRSDPAGFVTTGPRRSEDEGP